MNLSDYRNIKIAFFDIDGTMIDIGSRKITPKMLETLSGLQKNGIRICIATGRPPAILPQFPGIEFDAYLTFNASYCYTKNEVIFRNPIPAADVQTVIRNALKIQRPLALAGASRMGANGSDKDLADYFAISRHKLEIIDDFDELSREEIFQIMIGCRENEYASILEDVKGARITAWWDRAADIIPAAGGKGRGIRKVLEHFRLDAADAAAFGDGNNDIEMFQAVGTGVAMENASEQLKAEADEVCGHVAEDGIYYYCLERGMI